jgi:hypothetical protein
VNDDYKPVEQFIRYTLGCTCPDEVFKQIRVQSAPAPSGSIIKIHVGNRLLVYIWILDDLNQILRHLSAILKSGKNERDRMDFNRFRLVVGFTVGEERSRQTESAFSSCTETDDKMHLHIMHRKYIPRFEL